MGLINKGKGGDMKALVSLFNKISKIEREELIRIAIVMYKTIANIPRLYDVEAIEDNVSMTVDDGNTNIDVYVAYKKGTVTISANAKYDYDDEEMAAGSDNFTIVMKRKREEGSYDDEIVQIDFYNVVGEEDIHRLLSCEVRVQHMDNIEIIKEEYDEGNEVDILKYYIFSKVIYGIVNAIARSYEHIYSAEPHYEI